MAWHHLVSCLLLITLTPTGLRGECQFPSFLVTNSSDVDDFWHLADRYDGTYLEVRGNQSVATITYLPLNSTTPFKSTVTCLAMDGNYTVVEIAGARGDKPKVCLKFHQRTPNVITMHYREDVNKTTLQCLGSEEHLPIFFTANKPKGYISGRCQHPWNSHVISFAASHPANQTLCGHIQVPSVMESDCVEGDGLHLYFASNLCIPPNTGWTLNQHLYCLDSWEDESTHYGYQLLGENYYEPRYCLRFNTSTPDRVQVFQDLACIAQRDNAFPVKNAHFINWHLTQLKELECADNVWEGFQCLAEYCHIESYRRVCRETCAVCKVGSGNNCTFDDILGQWRLIEDGGFHDNISVSSDKFLIMHYADLTCKRQLWESHYLTQVSVKAGCAAQFACLHQFIMPQSPGLLAYQMYGKMHDMPPEPSSVCDADMKEDGRWPLHDRYISRALKNLLKEPIHGIMPCQLGGWYNFHGYTQDGTSCSGNMTDIQPDNCTTTHSVHMSLTCINITRMFCLFEPRDSLQMAIAATEDLAHASCIMVRREGDTVELSFLPSPQCTWSTRDEVLSGKRKFALRVNGTRDSSVCQGTAMPDTTAVFDNSTTPVPQSPGNNHAAALAAFFGITLLILLTGIVAYFAYKFYRRRHPYRVL